MPTRPLLAPGYNASPRRGFGVAKGDGSAWSPRRAAEAEQFGEAFPGIFPQRGWGKTPRTFARRSVQRAEMAYMTNEAYSSCVDLITHSILTNGKSPGARFWRVVPARDDYDEPLKNPDESQLAPWFNFVKKCHPTQVFDSLMVQIVTDFVKCNNVFAELALSDIRNQYGERQPGGLYLLPQSEIWPKVDRQGELDLDAPFWQLRDGDEPTKYTWTQILWAPHGTARAPKGVLPLTPADTIAVTVETMVEASKYVLDWFRSAGKTGVIFEKENWEEDEALDFIRWFEQNFTGSEGGHRPYALWGGLKLGAPVQNLGQLADFLEIIKAKHTTVAARFQTNARLVGGELFGAALANKGEREQIWFEFLCGPVNERKWELGLHLTHQIFRQGFGITDWNLEIVPFETLQDAQTFLQKAQAYVQLTQGGLVNWGRLADINAARADVSPTLEPVTEEELSIWPKPFLRGVPDPTAQVDPVQIGPDGQPIKVDAKVLAAGRVAPKALPPAEPKPEEPVTAKRSEEEERGLAEVGDALQSVLLGAGLDIETERRIVAAVRAAKVPPHLAAARELMDGFTDDHSREIVAKTKVAIDKSIAALKPIYERCHNTKKISDEDKAAYERACKPPAMGVLAADLRRGLKAHGAAAREQAAAEIAKRTKTAKRSAATEASPGGIENFIEMFGAHVFDDVYDGLTSALRDTFLRGLAAGWALAEFTDQVEQRTYGIAESQIPTIIRTSSTDIFNIGRQQAAQDSGEVVAYEYSAILDNRTTEVCKAAAGLQLAFSDPNVDRIRPPNHYNCRCVYTFVLTGESWTQATEAQIARVLALIPPNFGGKLKG